MGYTLVIHKVKDFDKWKEGFDGALKMRKEAGEVEARVFQSVDDSNNVIVMNKWENKDQATAFFESSELKKAMEEIGVEGEPQIIFMNEV